MQKMVGNSIGLVGVVVWCGTNGLLGYYFMSIAIKECIDSGMCTDVKNKIGS